MGADLILIDNPVKNREEAESRAYRDRVCDWYTDGLFRVTGHLSQHTRAYATRILTERSAWTN
jgi:hypothetical protein